MANKTKKRIKIALFHCGFIYSGGGERLVLEEGKILKQKGYKVEIFAPTLDREKCFPGLVKKLKVKTFLPQLPSFVPGRFALQMVLSSVFAPFIAPRFKKFDVFVGANQPGAWIAFCVSRVLRKPYIVYINQPNRILYPRKIDEQVGWQNLREYYFIDRLLKKLKFFVSWADRVSLTSSSVTLTNGGFISQVIADVYQITPVVCAAGCYPQKRSLLRHNPHTSYSGEFEIESSAGEKIPIKKPYILITNRHEPQKKFEYGIEAFSIVSKKNKNLKLIIPGPFTPYTKKIIRLARSKNILDRVVFTGQISEETLQRLYQEALVYIYTAPEEDFGMGIIEAMAWGVPVVAWNNAGPTVTVVSGETGYLAKPYDVEDFADKIIATIKDQNNRSKLGERAWKRAGRFSWKRHMNILEESLLFSLHQH